MHVVIALGCVFLRVGLGIDEHVVLVPSRQNTDSRVIFSVAGLQGLSVLEGCISRWEGLEDVSPGNSGFGPSSHGAVQLQSVALPHGLPAGLDDELRRVRQAVRVHLLTEL